MTPRLLRTILLATHLTAASTIGMALYSPLAGHPLRNAVMAYGLFPVLVVSGVGLWHQGRLTRLFRRAS